MSRLVPGYAILVEEKINQFNAIPQGKLSRFRHGKNGPYGPSYFHIIQRGDSLIHHLMFGPVAGHQSLLRRRGSQSMPSVSSYHMNSNSGEGTEQEMTVGQERTYGQVYSLYRWECAKIGKLADVYEPAPAHETKIIPAGIDKLRRYSNIRLRF